MENKKVRQLFRFPYKTVKTPKSRNAIGSRIIMNHIIHFLLLQLDLTLPKHPIKDYYYYII
jgi:hypothetical protein